ncbi:hypothetical protein FBEOM_7381 [Fusarium beomiforme]|uniref:Uncharacterized protein n=1 Tax=Fusarium beomiforme TaxID=44412 RepID=A0A9P5DXS8_9HYPO|nr:hypothetical protein FBEOM_7381 [Fusarium beomiforme]
MLGTAQSPRPKRSGSQDLPAGNTMKVSDLVRLQDYVLPSHVPSFKYSEDDTVWNCDGRKKIWYLDEAPTLFIHCSSASPIVVFWLGLARELTGRNGKMEEVLDTLLISNWYEKFESQEHGETEGQLPRHPFLHVLICTSAKIWDMDDRLNDWVKKNEEKIEKNHFFGVLDSYDTEGVWGHDFSWIIEANW